MAPRAPPPALPQARHDLGARFDELGGRISEIARILERWEEREAHVDELFLDSTRTNQRLTESVENLAASLALERAELLRKRERDLGKSGLAGLPAMRPRAVTYGEIRPDLDQVVLAASSKGHSMPSERVMEIIEHVADKHRLKQFDEDAVAALSLKRKIVVGTIMLVIGAIVTAAGTFVAGRASAPSALTAPAAH